MYRQGRAGQDQGRGPRYAMITEHMYLPTQLAWTRRMWVSVVRQVPGRGSDETELGPLRGGDTCAESGTHRGEHGQG